MELALQTPGLHQVIFALNRRPWRAVLPRPAYAGPARTGPPGTMTCRRPLARCATRWWAHGAERRAFQFNRRHCCFLGPAKFSRSERIQTRLGCCGSSSRWVRAKPGRPARGSGECLYPRPTRSMISSRGGAGSTRLTAEAGGFEAVVTLPSHSAWGSATTAQHGTPQDDDAWVARCCSMALRSKPGRYPAVTRVGTWRLPRLGARGEAHRAARRPTSCGAAIKVI